MAQTPWPLMEPEPQYDGKEWDCVTPYCHKRVHVVGTTTQHYEHTDGTTECLREL